MIPPGYQKKGDAVKINNVIDKVVTKLRKSMNKPVQNFRDKGIDVAVWNAKNGGYSFTIRKTYKNKQSGEYVETKYLYKEECEKLIELLQEAVKYASNSGARLESKGDCRRAKSRRANDAGSSSMPLVGTRFCYRGTVRHASHLLGLSILQSARRKLPQDSGTSSRRTSGRPVNA